MVQKCNIVDHIQRCESTIYILNMFIMEDWKIECGEVVLFIFFDVRHLTSFI